MNYILNNYRSKKIGDKYFLTTDHGSFCVLNDEEFKKLKQNKIDDKLIKKLEERELIINKKNYQETVKLMRNKLDFLFKGTSLHIVVVTLRCNMNCIYCHASSKPKNEKEYDMDKETAKKTVDFIFQTPNNAITIEFQGGEPLLNFDVVKYIIEYAQEKNKKIKKDMRITIVSNLTEMNEEKMNYFINKNVIVCTSLDGPKEVHDYNRKFIHGSNYDQVIKWIKRFNEEYKKRKIKNMGVGALVTLTKKSLDYPKEIVDEYVNLDLGEVHLRFLNNLGVAKKTWNDITYSVEEYLKFWKDAVGYIEELKKKKVKISERMVNLMSRKINDNFDPGYLDLRSPCGAAIGQLVYDYDGKIYTCDEARMIDEDLFLLGDVKKDNYKDVVTCDKACAVVNASINDQYICDNCVYKPYCGVCPVCNYAEQGNIIGKISVTDRCKIFKEQFDWVVREKFIKKNISN